MNRQQRRAAMAPARLRGCTPENLARAATMADQAGQPGVAELMRQVRRGELALFCNSDRDQTVTAAELNQAQRPTVLLIGDDDYRSTGPAGWRCSAAIAEWAAAAVIHAAGATAESYAAAAEAARLFGRAVLIETDTARAYEWAEVFKPRRVLMVLPKIGPHPILPPRGRMQ